MPKVIISYRRSDSQDITGRIRDRLVAHYGNRVYIDIDNIPIGTDFREHINKAMGDGDIVVAIVGPKWLGPTRGKRFRISDATDPVRVEIETALERKLTIVPVLVNGASMPKEAELPDTIKDFAYRNAVTVGTGQDFHAHVTRLIRGLDRLCPASRVPGAFLWRNNRRQISIGGAIAAAVAGILWFAYPFVWSESKSPRADLAGPRETPQKPKAVGGPLVPVPLPTDRPLPAPSPRKYFEADDSSLVYVEATGSARELVFAEPTAQLKSAGARPGDWMFVGRRIGDKYEGIAYLYIGACPDRRVSYAVNGPVIQEVTVEFTGEAPRIDPATCKHARAIDDQLLYDAKKTIIKFKFEK